MSEQAAEKEKTRFTKYVGQTPIRTGVLFHYIDPNEKGEYPVVESLYMAVATTKV